MNCLSLAVIAASSIFDAPAALAQSQAIDGNIEGFVRDAAGAAIGPSPVCAIAGMQSENSMVKQM